MNVLDVICHIYKKDLAEANEKKIILAAQCEAYKNRIKQLEEELAQLKANKDE